MSLLASTIRDALGRRHPVESLDAHLGAAIEWLCAAQDAARDGGVARSYALRHMRAHGRRGWLGAYPETTGYIIPTFLEYADRRGSPEHRERAHRMARWESTIQMESGAVQGGTTDFPPKPAVFNTGQVLFGWSHANRDRPDALYRNSLKKASEFLVEAQDEDGAWRRHGSTFARPGINTYDARSAWGLLVASAVTGEGSHREAAIRNLDFALAQQAPNGWFAHCCLDRNKAPLLHTIAYTMEGLLEGGLLAGIDRFVEGARRTADSLLARLRPDGGLSGRFDDGWKAAARWSCLTGNAQTALVWLRLYETTGAPRYLEAARKLLRFVAATQDRTSSHPGIRGGIKGSQPIWGEYAPYEYLNWAAKFFADALLTLERTGEACEL